MNAFAVKSNARVNSRQTCDGGDLKESCRERASISLDKIKTQREGDCCEMQCDG